MQAERIISSWFRTRRAMRRSASGLRKNRERLWEALQPALRRTPALAAYAGKPLSQFPVTEIKDMRSDYGAWNSLGLDHDALSVLADAEEAGEAAPGELSAGWSTGSGGGPRGLFLTDRAERADYIGQSLARLLPARALLRRQRIALNLRAGNALYSDAGRGRWSFGYFSLAASPVETMSALAAWVPNILIAPPHRLIAFAEAGLRLTSLRHLFCGSEPISAAERSFIGERIGLFPRSIYQATEGFLGAECSEGHLHLNDHALTIELEPVPCTIGFRPIITDLRRKSQPIVRLRGDDYIELDERQCLCGYAGRTIRSVEGRVQDLWYVQAHCITPPQVVAAVEGVLGGGRRWQALGYPGGARLRVAPDCPPSIAENAGQALSKVAEMSVAVNYDLPVWSEAKRRKVVWSDG